MFQIGGADAVKKVRITDMEETKGRRGREIKGKQNILSAGLLINGTVVGTPPEMGVAGTMWS